MREVLDAEVTVTLASTFSSMCFWGEQAKKGFLSNISGGSSIGPRSIGMVGFMDYLDIGLKCSPLNRRPFHPSSAPRLDQSCRWGFSGFPLWAKVFRADLGTPPQ